MQIIFAQMLLLSLLLQQVDNVADDGWQSVALSSGRAAELKPVREGEVQWFITRDDFAVIRTPARYEYAFQNEAGGLVASGCIARPLNRALPFPTGIRPSPEYLRMRRAAAPAGGPPSPHPVQVAQPDGTLLELFLKGSSGVTWYEDKQGYTIVTIPGRYEYAIRGPSGALIGSGIELESMKASDIGVRPGLKPSDEFLRNASDGD